MFTVYSDEDTTKCLSEGIADTVPDPHAHKMAAAGATWAQVRQQTRAAETQVSVEILPALQSADLSQTDNLFSTYSQFASKTEIDPKPSESELRTEEQLNEILEKVCRFRPPTKSTLRH